MPHAENFLCKKTLGDSRKLNVYIKITFAGHWKRLGFSFGLLWPFEIFLCSWQQTSNEKGKIRAIWKSSSEVLWAQDSLGWNLIQEMTDQEVLLNEQENVADKTLRPGAGCLGPAGKPPPPTCAWPKENYFCCLTRLPEGSISSLPCQADF